MREKDVRAGTVRVPLSRIHVVLDAGTAVFLAAVLGASSLTPTRGYPVTEVWLRLLLAGLSASVVVTRRFAPIGSLALAIGASGLSWLLGFERDSFLTAAIVLYLVAATRPPRRSLLALSTSALLTASVYAMVIPVHPAGTTILRGPWWKNAAESFTPIALQGAAWALGLAVYRQRSYVEAVRAQAARELGAERDRAARSAAEERLRIARDLHDIVAHAMSVITVQAGVARYIRSGDPDPAGAALGVIENTGRQALRDMRQLLGVLRDEADGIPQAPAPGLADLPDLLDGTRATGTRVELQVRGDARSLPEGLELSAYRIVQEALTNVVKHAATDRAEVVLDYAPLELCITVIDDGAGAGAGTDAGSAVFPGSGPASVHTARDRGHGLIGMRERAALHGGSVDAGPLPVRGFRVAARLPIPPTPENAAAAEGAANADADGESGAADGGNATTGDVETVTDAAAENAGPPLSVTRVTSTAGKQLTAGSAKSNSG